MQETGKQFSRSYRASPELLGDIRALTVMENIKNKWKKYCKIKETGLPENCPRVLPDRSGSRPAALWESFWSCRCAFLENFWELSGSLFGPVWKEFRGIPGVAPELPGGRGNSDQLHCPLFSTTFLHFFLNFFIGGARSAPELPGSLSRTTALFISSSFKIHLWQ